MKKLILFAFVAMLGFVSLQSFTLVEQPAEATSMATYGNFSEQHFYDWLAANGGINPGGDAVLLYHDDACRHLALNGAPISAQAIRAYMQIFHVLSEEMPYLSFRYLNNPTMGYYFRDVF